MSEPARFCCRKLPGAPLRSFDCFAATVHVALPGVAVHCAVLATVTSALTDVPAVSPFALELERSSRMPALSTTAVHPGWLTFVPTVPGASVRPDGAVKFA